MEQRHVTRLRVRLSETDTLGIVYYGQYFVYFDVARLELLRELGITSDYLQRLGLHFVAAEASCRYFGSARFDELLQVKTWISKLGNSSIRYEHIIERENDGQKLVHGFVVDVLVDADGRPVSLPAEMREKLSKYLIPQREEAGATA
ncbi:MAG: acyl-CoA thioesterase [Aigarchaeota archaeon]|nr:acyl-CoA thioesterase [Candidatus Pelearchaeum maunauluense]